MSGSLLRPDLNLLPAGEESFVGRAAALGSRYGRLPASYPDRLMGYLRLRATAHARRHRTGIRLEREGLEAGIRQSVACLDLALGEASVGDLNAAAEVLATSDLESLRRRGWEIAFGRLEEMRRQSRRLLGLPHAALLAEHRAGLKRWSTVVPETWQGRDLGGEAADVDPQVDWAAFLQVQWRAQFVASLPEPAVQELLGHRRSGCTFAGLLRRMVVAVGLDRPSLVVHAEELRRFAELVMDGGRIRPEAARRIGEEIAGHARQALAEPAARQLVVQEVEAAMAALHGCAGAQLAEWLRGPRPGGARPDPR
ncbi:MAG: hypothetical protein AB1505_15425 [Candidatus Latescibacterota bacterium]